MRRRTTLGAAVLALLLLAGCGGNDTYNPTTEGGGTATFLIAVSPATRTLAQGQQTTYTVTLTAQNGFASPVTLSVTGLPADTTASFDPPTVTPTAQGATSTLTVQTSGTGTGSLSGTLRTSRAPTPPGTYPLTVRGTGGGVTKQATTQLVVQAEQTPLFTMSVAPASRPVTAGQSTTYTVTLTAENAFNSAVDLTVSGLPSGATATFAPASPITPTAQGAQTTLTVQTATSTPAGTATMIIHGSGGGKSNQASVTLVVETAGVFSPVPDPRQMTISPDGQFLYVVSVNTRSIFQFRINANGVLTALSPASIGDLPGPLVFDIQAHPLSNAPFVYATSPSQNLLLQFRYDTGGLLTSLTPPTVSASPEALPAGIAGIAIHPNGMFLYTADPVSQAQGVIPRISLFRINAGGTLAPLGPDVLVVPGFNVNRIAITPNGQFLYTNSHLRASGGQTLKAFRINTDGTLTSIGEFGGQTFSRFELTVDPTGRFLYTANTDVGGASVSAFQINTDGSLAGLGAALPAGTSAPTSITVTPDGKFVYTVAATDDRLFLYGVNADGSLRALTPASVATGDTPIDVKITPNGQFLYVSNSGSNSISQFRINANGSLTPL